MMVKQNAVDPRWQHGGEVNLYGCFLSSLAACAAHKFGVEISASMLLDFYKDCLETESRIVPDISIVSENCWINSRMETVENAALFFAGRHVKAMEVFRNFSYQELRYKNSGDPKAEAEYIIFMGPTRATEEHFKVVSPFHYDPWSPDQKFLNHKYSIGFNIEVTS